MGMLRKGGTIKESTALPDPVPSSNLLTIQTLEEYCNHLGAVDNFTQTGTAGNGTVTSNAATHDMTISSGANLNGHAYWESKKSWAPSSNIYVGSFMISNVASAALGIAAEVGFCSDWTDVNIQTNAVDQARFSFVNNTWKAVTSVTGGGLSITSFGIPSDGDVITIVITSSKVDYYINGVIALRVTTGLPTAAMKFGARARNGLAVASAATINLDMFSFKRFVV